MRELLSKALAELDNADSFGVPGLKALIDEIQDELAKPEPEPVRCQIKHKDGLYVGTLPYPIPEYQAIDLSESGMIIEPLYTNPPAQQNPLSGQAIIECIPDDLKRVVMGNEDSIFAFARAIEAAHGIK